MSAGSAGTRSRGAWAEQRAARYLEEHGLAVLERNYRCRAGELDLICLEGARVAFVEVRYRRDGALVSAAQSVDASKQRRLRLAAAHYLHFHGELRHRPCRFDVVTVTGTGEDSEIGWIRDAFQDDG